MALENESTALTQSSETTQEILAEMAGFMRKSENLQNEVDSRLKKSAQIELLLEQDLGMSLSSLKCQLDFLPKESPEEEYAIHKTINELIEIHSEKPKRNVFIAPNAI